MELLPTPLQSACTEASGSAFWRTKAKIVIHVQLQQTEQTQPTPNLKMGLGCQYSQEGPTPWSL